MSPTPQLAVDLSSHLAGGPGWAVGVTAETTPSPAPTGGELRPGLEPTDVSPGLPGFLTIFAVALACVALFLSMNKQLRKVRHDERSVRPGNGGGSGASDGGSRSHDGPSDDSGGSGSSGGDSGGGGD
ncbi:hypothetical protein EQW78_08125 [Oerskovia turbata]|uniref:Uncharacterized protein n=1 Tax=Oerskovia turbata TaxID=1713 RepID=A0A4V1N558_9CELL|nr:hypothetical protein [Oerskovia turbata]RXR26783.1 hypothetical protein EQW73_04630 [Oerskovia turbata]RXR34516.1 hypothetical protein EQW78_08125 [Oerskovia turbata]TGJ97792.1 hypothetical protein DLJ96_07740 [Actinotalea fermentans ATCC 43279 = JCM 9966 = DSM 3133]